jgi:hypothetical protein
MKIYKILARPTLAYGSESWTIRSNDRKRLISAEMRFTRTLGYTLFDHKRNEELMDIMDKQLKTAPIIDFVAQFPEKLDRTCTQNDSRQDTKNDFKIPTKRKEVSRPLLCKARNRP